MNSSVMKNSIAKMGINEGKRATLDRMKPMIAQ